MFRLSLLITHASLTESLYAPPVSSHLCSMWLPPSSTNLFLSSVLPITLYAFPCLSHACYMPRLFIPYNWPDPFHASLTDTSVCASHLNITLPPPHLTHMKYIHTRMYLLRWPHLKWVRAYYSWSLYVSLGPKGTEVEIYIVPFVRAFGWYRHPDNILSKRTASTNRERCDKSICSSQAIEMDVPGVASHSSCLFWLRVTILHSEAIFWRDGRRRRL
jgi:hypothetical protein